jgi:hypothetical protein
MLDPMNEDKEETPLTDATGLENGESHLRTLQLHPNGRGRRTGLALSSMKLKDGRKIRFPETRIISKFASKDFLQE